MATETAVVEDLEELEALCGKATVYNEGGRRYILLEHLELPDGCISGPALLCPQEHEGYLTRLFLASPQPKGNNWKVLRILDREWHTWSWQGIAADQRLVQILAGHLRGLR
jgi:hypothetical protein